MAVGPLLERNAADEGPVEGNRERAAASAPNSLLPKRGAGGIAGASCLRGYALLPTVCT